MRKPQRGINNIRGRIKSRSGILTSDVQFVSTRWILTSVYVIEKKQFALRIKLIILSS